MDYLMVFFSQTIFQLLRVKSNIAIYKNNKIGIVTYSFLLQVLWLLSTYYGITGIIKQDYLLPVLYVLGGTAGAYISMKFGGGKI